MSVTHMAVVWTIPKSQISATEKLVLLCLADNANDEGICWPSVENMRKRCGVNKDTVCQVINRLELKGFVRTQKRYSKSSIYTLTLPLSGAAVNCKNKSPARPYASIRRGRTPVSGEAVPNHQGTTIEPPQWDLLKTIARGAIALRHATLEQAKAILPRADISSLESEWLSLGREPPNNPDAAFIGWIRKYAIHNPHLARA